MRNGDPRVCTYWDQRIAKCVHSMNHTRWGNQRGCRGSKECALYRHYEHSAALEEEVLVKLVKNMAVLKMDGRTMGKDDVLILSLSGEVPITRLNKVGEDLERVLENSTGRKFRIVVLPDGIKAETHPRPDCVQPAGPLSSEEPPIFRRFHNVPLDVEQICYLLQLLQGGPLNERTMPICRELWRAAHGG